MSEDKFKWTPYPPGMFYAPECDPFTVLRHSGLLSKHPEFLDRAADMIADRFVFGNKEPNGFPCVSETHKECNKSCLEHAVRNSSFVSVDLGFDVVSFKDKRDLRQLQNKLKFSNKGI